MLGQKAIQTADGMPTLIDVDDITAEMLGLSDDDWQKTLKELEGIITEATALQAGIATDFIGIAFTSELIDDNYRKAVLERVINLKNVVDETTIEAVRTAVRVHIESGGSIPQLANYVKESVTEGIGNFSFKERAEIIARTESSWAMNEGSMMSYREGGVEYQQWWVSFSERTCDYCRPMHGQVMGTGQSYWDKDESMYPAKGMVPDTDRKGMTFGHGNVTHPPAHPRCRCVLLPYWVDIDGPIQDDLNWKKVKENWRVQ